MAVGRIKGLTIDAAVEGSGIYHKAYFLFFLRIGSFLGAEFELEQACKPLRVLHEPSRVTSRADALWCPSTALPTPSNSHHHHLLVRLRHVYERRISFFPTTQCCRASCVFVYRGSLSLSPRLPRFVAQEAEEVVEDGRQKAGDRRQETGEDAVQLATRLTSDSGCLSCIRRRRAGVSFSALYTKYVCPKTHATFFVLSMPHIATKGHRRQALCSRNKM